MLRRRAASAESPVALRASVLLACPVIAALTAFADLRLTPSIYLLSDMIITFRRYLEGLPEPVAREAVPRLRMVALVAA